MSDCANVEMRELLPELVAGSLNAAARARLERHLATCADCASELETLRLVRASFANTPTVNVSRIVAALPRPVSVAPRRRPPTTVRRWVDWRIAAALTTITVGGLSMAVANRMRQPSVIVPSPAMTPREGGAAASGIDSPPNAVVPEGGPPRDSGPARVHDSQPAAAAAVQLTFGGGVGDLDEASLRSLLGALDEIDRSPLAPPAEPDQTPLLPIIEEGGR